METKNKGKENKKWYKRVIWIMFILSIIFILFVIVSTWYRIYEESNYIPDMPIAREDSSSINWEETLNASNVDLLEVDPGFDDFWDVDHSFNSQLKWVAESRYD